MNKRTKFHGWDVHGVFFPSQIVSAYKLSYTYLPTSTLLEDRIRVFFASRDSQDIGRIYCADFSREIDPKLIEFYKDPILDIGNSGCFDEHGVSPLSVLRVKNEHYMYYLGWQRSESVRYFLFMGLAVSVDGCNSFKRIQDTPIIGQSPGMHQVRGGGSFIFEKGLFKVWYAEQNGSVVVRNKRTPSYNWSYMCSEDGINWPEKGTICKKITDKIFGYGRASIIKQGGFYHAWVSVRTLEDGYKIGYCSSMDGVAWSSFDFSKGIVSEGEEASCASVIRLEDRLMMFYNGDNFGKDGIYFATVDQNILDKK